MFGRVEKFHSALGEVQARNKSAELLNRGIAVQHEWGLHLRLPLFAAWRGFRARLATLEAYFNINCVHFKGYPFWRQQCSVGLVCSVWVNITVLLFLFNDLLIHLRRTSTCKLDRISLHCWPQWYLVAVSSTGYFFFVEYLFPSVLNFVTFLVSLK